MAGSRQNRISMVDSFLTCLLGLNANAKQTRVDHSSTLTVYKGRCSKTSKEVKIFKHEQWLKRNICLWDCVLLN